LKHLKVGDRVKDCGFNNGLTGTVFKIKYGTDISNHGFIYVKLDPQCIGKFNCSPKDEEHYCEFEWFKFLKKI